MKLLFFDTETSDITPGSICELSYIIADIDKKQLYGRNFFFAVDKVSKGAFDVHGLSVEKLKELSNGKRFCDFAKEIYKDFANADVLIGHNVNFDIRYIDTEFDRVGMTAPNKETFDSMKFYTNICNIKKNGRTKWPKLEEVIKFLEIDNSKIETFCNKVFNGCSGFHDSRFDIAGTYLIVVEAVKKGYLEKGYFSGRN